MKCKPSSPKRGRKNLPVPKLPKDYPWKVLYALTKDLRQYLNESEFQRIEDIIRKRDVPSLLELSEEWGLQCKPPTDWSDFQSWKARYSLAALLKKYLFAGSSETLKSNALNKFFDAEEKCHFFNLEGWKKLANPDEDWKVIALTQAKAFLQKLLGVTLPEHEALTEWSRHGPGATTGTKSGHVSSYFKYSDWPYHCTASAFLAAKSAIRSDERWLGALEDDYRERFNVPKHALLDRKVFWSNILKIVPGARLAFVPKNAKTFRTITIEPTLNVFLQLGVDGFIRRRLKRWGVDLDSQEKNQRLARIGSYEGDDPFVTIDLSSASDTVSKRLVDWLLPDEWTSYLLQIRSPSCVLESGEEVYFHKFSAMGNGFTFVLESAIFTSIIYGVMMATNGVFQREEMAVYGDDLICRRSISSRVLALLSDCGFTVNSEKSFFDGYVRESCGCDWARGIPIRPVFLDDAPTNISELFSARNRLKRFLSLRWGLEESETVGLLDSWVPEIFRGLVGPVSDTEYDSWLHSSYAVYREHYPHVVRRIDKPFHLRVVRYIPTILRSGQLTFNFVKLMHDLRELDQPDAPYIRTKRFVGKGSRFTVHVRNREAVGIRTSAVWNFQAEYAEALPSLM